MLKKKTLSNCGIHLWLQTGLHCKMQPKESNALKNSILVRSYNIAS